VHIHSLLVSLALILGPAGGQAADLVVWWVKGANLQEDAALREVIAAFEQESGKQVELVLYEDGDALPQAIEAALTAGRPPDVAFGFRLPDYISTWAFDDRLVDLTDSVGHYADLFDREGLAWYTLLNQKTGQRSLYGLPIGRFTNLVHVWTSLLKKAGFTVETFRRSGRRSGFSGANRSSRRCAGP
jgi:ABC-type glycerol-3-phosphate transport system substrate-binding protein